MEIFDNNLKNVLNEEYTSYSNTITSLYTSNINDSDSDSDSDSDYYNNNTNTGGTGSNTNNNITNKDYTPINLEYISEDDKVSEFIKKINYNFYQFAIYNGGLPGKDGQNGYDGITQMVKTRIGIHYIPQSQDIEIPTTTNCLSTEFKNQVFNYFDNKKEELLEGDAIIIKNCIYRCYLLSSNKLSLSLVSKIVGETGKDGKGISNFTRGDDEEMKKLPDILHQYLFFEKGKSTDGIIFCNADDIINENIVLTNSDNNEISYNNSIILTKDNDSISFFKKDKDDNNHLIKKTSILSETDRFIISDRSKQGSVYYSNGNSIIIGVGNDFSVEDNDNIPARIRLNNYNITDTDDTDKIFITGNTSLSGNLNVTGNASLSGNLDVTGNASLSGNLDVTGNTSLSGNLNVTGNTSLSNVEANNIKTNNSISSESIETNNLTVNNSISSESIETNNLTVNNSISSESIETNNLTVNNSIETKSIETGNLTVNKDITLNNIEENIFNTNNLIEIIKKLKDTINDLKNLTGDLDLPIGTIISSVSASPYSNTLYKDLGYTKCDGRTLEKLVDDGELTEEESKECYKQLTGIDKYDSNYKIPDMGGRVLIGEHLETKHHIDFLNKERTFIVGQNYGSQFVNLTVDNLPPHNHYYCGDGDWAGHNGKNYIAPLPYGIISEKRGGADNGKGRWYKTTDTGVGTSINITPKSLCVTYYIKIKSKKSLE